MYPHPRESKSKFSSGDFNNVVTAEFTIPSGNSRSKEGVTILPTNAYQHAYPHPKTFSDYVSIETNSESSSSAPFCIRLDFEESTWKLDICHNWLYSLSPLRKHSNLIRGSIHFRSKSFGKWEPIEFMKDFVRSSTKDENSGTRIIHSIFPVALLETTTPKYTLEMTLRLEHIITCNVEETLLSQHRAEMKNKLLPALPKSDLSLKVDDEEFFVHSLQISAFSSAIKITKPNRKGGSSCDLSRTITKNSIQALLRFIYYNEIDTINCPAVAFILLKFSHAHNEGVLFEVCEDKFKYFKPEEYSSWDEILEMYTFFGADQMFEKLKICLLRLLHSNLP